MMALISSSDRPPLNGFSTVAACGGDSMGGGGGELTSFAFLASSFPGPGLSASVVASPPGEPEDVVSGPDAGFAGPQAITNTRGQNRGIDRASFMERT